MKKTLYLILILTSASGGCNRMNLETRVTPCTPTDAINVTHSKAEKLQEKIDRIVSEGVPGTVIAIHDIEGYWTGTSGFAKIETNTPMQPCHLQYGQSVAKTYMSVAILLLHEEGRIDLDQNITAYLPETVLSRVNGADQVTVQMLLNHTSGIEEYNDKPNYVTYLLQHPLHTFSTMDYLDFIDGDPLKFTPGSKYSYTNTNYILLALIADQITGDHAEYIHDNILAAHELHNTYYHEEGFLERPELVNSYWDRYSNGEIENCSEMQKTNVRSLIGDDGIIATPVDYVKFLQALMEGDILRSSTMDEMFTFVRKKPDEPDEHGLGIHRDYYNGHPEYGHSGGGIGSGCLLGYFPDNEVYYFLGINMGTSIYSPNFDDLEDIIDEIYDVLLE